jgi:hypothetical protein
MGSVKGKCKKCGTTYGYYASVESAKHNVSIHKCKKGGSCEADV